MNSGLINPANIEEVLFNFLSPHKQATSSDQQKQVQDSLASLSFPLFMHANNSTIKLDLS